MDSSTPSTSNCDSSAIRDARNGEGLAVDEIMRMKEKRLRLLDNYRNEQEENLLPLMREAEDINRKKRKKPRSQPNAENNIPLRRSERIMTQTLNGNRTRESQMHQPQHEPESEPEPEPEPEPAPMSESEQEPAPMPEFDSEPESLNGFDLLHPLTPVFEPRPAFMDESESQYSSDDSDDEGPRRRRRRRRRGARRARPTRRSARLPFEVDPTGMNYFDIKLASRRVFAVYPAPSRMVVPVPVPEWVRPYPVVINTNENWYGPTEGFEIGYHWRTRLECSHDKVHRPSIAGIHAGPEGAYSVALSGAYPEDIDEGNIVIFTGAGGRDLKAARGRSRSVRGAPQVRDQELNKANLSLIRSVITGYPVRLIRGYKLASSFAPDHGYRYDGLYQVVHYCYTLGHSGFRVFRFKMFRMENQTPPPWETGWAASIPRRPPRNTESPLTALTLAPRNGASVQNGRYADTANSEELDEEIDDCIKKLCHNSYYEAKADGKRLMTSFHGWNMP